MLRRINFYCRLSHHLPFLRLLPLAILLTMISPQTNHGQSFEPNYDEAKIPEYQLPPSLVRRDGSEVTSADDWQQRRTEILELFRDHVYGDLGVSVDEFDLQITRHPLADDAQTGAKRDRMEVNVRMRDQPDQKPLTLDCLILRPAEDATAEARLVPAFLTLNFQGNHTISEAKDIPVTDHWVRDRKDGTSDGNRALEAGRGVAASRWPVDMINKRGYALITLYYGDIDPDYDDDFENGLHRLCRDQWLPVKPNRRGGSIAAWAMGLSLVLNALEQLALEQSPELGIDTKRVAVLGHSRLGKTSLWAGATDPRFGLVISNNSGCGGAALSRRAIGETVERINTSFPHWFCDGFNEFNRNENACPVDQHQLIALCAPRAVAIASATGDQWADPKGEFLAGIHASDVYRLHGLPGLLDDNGHPPDNLPAPDHGYQGGTIGYHLREGKHDLTAHDWGRYLDFADKHLK